MAKGKNVLPKKIAGYKVPKRLRRSRVLRALLHSPMGRQVAADALVAGAGAASAVLLRDREEVADAARTGARKSGHAVALLTEAGESAAHAVMGVIAEAARSVLPEDDRKHHGGGRKQRPPQGTTRH
jgi:hypothetical protein